VLTTVQKTRLCPYCRETIADEAVKCRYCAEFIERDEPGKNDGKEKVLFESRPSLLGLVGPAAKASIVMAAAAALTIYPVERLNIIASRAPFEIAPYRIATGLALAAVVVMAMAYKVLRLKMTSYLVTSERVEHSRGVFDRKVDNLDMFRVIDLKLRKSLLDCLLGIGTVELITTDKTDPAFAFDKLRECRVLYDAIKKASLEADRTNRVVHLE
jgi:hypothetical protein